MRNKVPDELQGTEILTTFGISRRTLQRWRKIGMPRRYAALAKLAVLGDLEQLATNWRGWRISQGRLCAPDGSAWSFTPGEVRSIPFLHMQIAALQRRYDALSKDTKMRPSHHAKREVPLRTMERRSGRI
jgi:hypothetical protein